MSADPQDVMGLLDALHSPDETAQLKALANIQTANIRDPRIMLAVEAIMNDSPHLGVQRVARETLSQLGYKMPLLSEERGVPQFGESASDRDLLIEILHTIRTQQKILEEVQSKMGCVYQFIMALIILIIIVNLLQLFR